ncbi:uncharacterized protein LOC100842705 [Brachypodium distachyon]|uniref:uncharacterized protein LOC100842705 n=1 Tax=Brachypodium distachyon TaxID=15368 RepID=UPI00052FF5D7|nr:uncharacterized protein LOC100842705 [Brachypodium distachyon]|eukprot:XP_010229894.1 uncharacterized protein LOC100842705 [Brachypodium distachyon]
MHCERAAVARGEAVDNFAVLVHAKAPPAAAGRARAPVDLVAVLDVSGSMQGNKLALVKGAMGFVVDKLGPADRLSIVAFSDSARRVLHLARMSDAGRASAKLAVESLQAGGCTNIRDGLAVAAKMLDGRRHRNAVAAVILLSDGQDSFTRSYHRDLVPRSLMAATRSDGGRSSGTPVHAFGFGADHDAAAMHAIAEATAGGTFSFVENQAVVQDAFAQCIGGVLSVAAQEAWLAIACPAHRSGARVRAVKSGRYASRVVAYGRAAEVDVGELYADEERRFLVFLDMPAAGARDDDEEGDVTTRLLKVSCTYKDAATGRSMEVAGGDAVVRRPAEAEDEEPSKEVEVERFRVEAAEDMAAARAAAERGDHGEAARILDRRQDALRRSPAAASDARCAALAWELRELAARVASRAEYERSGRAFAFAGASAHAQQRASGVTLFGAMAPTAAPGFASAPFLQCGTPAFGSTAAFSPFHQCGSAAAGPFATPAMRAMVDESREAREKRQQQPAAPAPTTTRS